MANEGNETVTGPGWVQQYMRTAAAVVAAFALALGVLIMADELAQQTELLEEQVHIERLNSIQIDRQSFELESQTEQMQQQTNLMGQQMDRSECVDYLMARLAGIQVLATENGSDWDLETSLTISALIGSLTNNCFSSDGVFDE